MHRDGCLTVSDMVDRLDTLILACSKCGRHGRYRVARLNLPAWCYLGVSGGRRDLARPFCCPRFRYNKSITQIETSPFRRILGRDLRPGISAISLRLKEQRRCMKVKK